MPTAELHLRPLAMSIQCSLPLSFTACLHSSSIPYLYFLCDFTHMTRSMKVVTKSAILFSSGPKALACLSSVPGIVIGYEIQGPRERDLAQKH